MEPVSPHKLALVAVLVTVAAAFCPLPRSARAAGSGSALNIRRVIDGAGEREVREGAAARLAWEVRKRTSVETRLAPTTARLDAPDIFRTPLLYWSGEAGFEPLSEAKIAGLRRFVEYGGFVLIDDAAPDTGQFDASIRRTLSRAFPRERLQQLKADHTVFRSFYLLNGPTGRYADPGYLEAIVHAGRAAVVYSRHDLGGAWARNSLGQPMFNVTPGGEWQRERAVRLGVNLVMYALCLDYKDDQVHAPFIMRRRGGRP